MPPRGSLHWSSVAAVLVAALLSVVPVGIIAQTTTSQAVCLQSYSWMDNSKGQSPCVIIGYLGGVCYNGQFSVPPLAANYVYYGPQADQPKQLQCECNSVFYSVSSACGLCQGNDIISWNAWSFNCSNTTTGAVEGSFPPGIPAGTAVPQWAFQDVAVSNTFNITLAQLIGDAPESTGTLVQTTSSVTTSKTSTAASLTPSPSTTNSSSNPAPSSSASNTGAIVGGVVGGVAGIAVIAGVIAVIISMLRKKRAENPPSVRYSVAQTSSPAPPSHITPTFAPQAAQRLYDPSDPSTFPPSSPVASNPTFSNSSINPSVRPGAYTGVPEVQR